MKSYSTWSVIIFTWFFCFCFLFFVLFFVLCCIWLFQNNKCITYTNKNLYIYRAIYYCGNSTSLLYWVIKKPNKTPFIILKCYRKLSLLNKCDIQLGLHDFPWNSFGASEISLKDFSFCYNPCLFPTVRQMTIQITTCFVGGTSCNARWNIPMQGGLVGLSWPGRLLRIFESAPLNLFWWCH